MNYRTGRKTLTAAPTAAARDFLIARLMVAALILTALPMARAGAEPATEAPPRPEMRLAEAGRGELLFRGDREGIFTVAPQLTTDVMMNVSGMVNRVTVRQRFANPDNAWVEGIYVFPLPETAAVDHLRMQVGDRFIDGLIREREQARRDYEQAKAEGKTASLLEQERPNIFTTSVANIGPREEIVIEIEYQETLAYDGGTFSLRFPMVVGPRYIPGEVQVAGFGGSGWADNTARVPDAARITPPVLHPALGKINPVSLEVVLDAGFPLAEIVSATHDIAVQELEDDRVAVTLDAAEVPADRDFALSWTPAVGAAPGAGLFVERRADGNYLLLMIMPPTEILPGYVPPPREITYVIDTSGSMSGTSIVQVRAALGLALNRLRPEDRFNIIQFNSDTSSLFPEVVAATPGAVMAAKRYVARLHADGGTEMLSAMKAALGGGDGDGDGRLRQVIFLTDGAIGNESELFETINKRLGDRRLFTIGIGSAPNSYFMRKAAEYGRGTFTHIDDLEEVAAEMAALFVKLEQPVVTDMSIAWPDGVEVEAMPRRLPDLYQGEPVVVTARIGALRDNLGLRGRREQDDWILTVPLTSGADHDGIAALWARAKIDELDDSVHGGADPTEVRKAIVDVALDHHLVSAHTSLVAIDVTPRRPDGETADTRTIATNLPAGWDFDAVFGTHDERRRGITPALRKASLTDPSAAGTQLAAMPLPQGATAAELHLLVGLLMLLLALALAWRVRRPHGAA
ncbi:MAG: marine proteobacterial sortase target protein [Alphaproteobacteria bacterium]|nr:marine proteobacterial sortase target protein [Alphaproteobacteria bacterium]